VPGFRLTVRDGPKVERDRFETLDDAIGALRERAHEIANAGRLGAAQGFREYEPGDRVRARLQVSTGGWLRGHEAGIDVMGDGRLVPFVGAIRRRELDGDPFDAVAAALS
jgi:hypothetical protein